MAPKKRFTPDMLDGLMHLSVAEQCKAIGAGRSAVLRLRKQRPDYVKYTGMGKYPRKPRWTVEQLNPLLDQSIDEQATALGCSRSKITDLRRDHPYYQGIVQRAAILRELKAMDTEMLRGVLREYRATEAFATAVVEGFNQGMTEHDPKKEN